MIKRQLLKNNSLHLLKATTQSISTGLGAQLLLLVSGPLVARILGVDGRGYLAALNAWATMLGIVGTLGVPVACAYFLNQSSTYKDRLVGEAYRIAFLQALALTGVLALTLFAWSRGKPIEVQTSIYVTLLIIPAILFHQYSLAILQGHQQFWTFNVMRILPLTFYVLGVVMLFFLNQNHLIVVVVIWTSANLLAAIISTSVVLKTTQIDWHGETGLRKQLLQFGLRGHLGAVAPLDGLRLDQLAASIFLAPAALGLYVVAQAFTNLPRFISQSAGMVAYPSVALQQKAPTAAIRLIWNYFWGVTLINSLLALLLIFTMPFLIPFFFGQDFASSIPIAQILIVGTTFAASRRILVEGMRGLGHPQISTFAEVSMYPWLLSGGIFLLWQYNIEGLAVAVTIAYALSLFVAVVRTLKAINDIPESISKRTGISTSTG
ncbi:MAG: oligosaccharide flippase family protein [Nitrospirales bacterium]|nr:oligosaccharide flippase family protein [Nitrospirales bacterium]